MSTQFGRFRLERLLGRGGMGEVHEAFDTRTQRLVALKLLRPELAADPNFRARFRREAALVARIEGPHVVPVHDYGEIDGRIYIAMQLVRGVDLGVLLRDGPLPAERAVDIVGQVAEALDTAHADGLVHRDVKPSNVLVAGTHRDHAYLADFGIARPARPEGTSLTETGAAVGTLDYMAPERFTGAPPDHRADVYALACLLFEALTGRRPYPADDPIAMMYAHVHRPPPVPSADRAGLPAGLDEVVARGMAKEPADRFASAGALAAAARAALGGTPPGGTPPGGTPPGGTPPGERPPDEDAPTADVTVRHPRSGTLVDAPAAPSGPAGRTGRTVTTGTTGTAGTAPDRRRRLVPLAAVAAVLAAVLGASLAVPLLSDRTEPAAPPAVAAAPPVLTSAGATTVGSGAVRVDTVGDGRLLAALTVDGLALVDTATAEIVGTVAVPGAEDRAIAVTPDGHRVAVGTTEGVALVETGTDTGTDTRLADRVALGGPATALVVHPGTGELVVATADGLQRLDPLTGADQGSLAMPGQKFGLAASAASAAGDRVHVTNADTNEVLAVDTATARVVASVPVTGPSAIALAPDGSRAYVARLGAVDVLDVLDTADQAVVATVPVAPATDRPEIGLSPDGRHAFVTATGAITVLDTATAAVVASVETGPGRDPADVVVTADGVLVVGTLHGEVLTYTAA